MSELHPLSSLRDSFEALNMPNVNRIEAARSSHLFLNRSQQNEGPEISGILLRHGFLHFVGGSAVCNQVPAGFIANCGCFGSDHFPLRRLIGSELRNPSR